MRIDYAVRMFQFWYKGDGVYGDGEPFHADYYNSFVIHPMLLDILAANPDLEQDYPALYRQLALDRAARYGAILERLIGPDGSYPVVGRSITYRFGAFQLLSQLALQHRLGEEGPSPAQVRCGLTAVLRRVMTAPGLFDASGWLQRACMACSPISRKATSTREAFICAARFFLPLGLPDSDPFWAMPDEPWTAKRVWRAAPSPSITAIDKSGARQLSFSAAAKKPSLLSFLKRMNLRILEKIENARDFDRFLQAIGCVWQGKRLQNTGARIFGPAWKSKTRRVIFCDAAKEGESHETGVEDPDGLRGVVVACRLHSRWRGRPADLRQLPCPAGHVAFVERGCVIRGQPGQPGSRLLRGGEQIRGGSHAVPCHPRQTGFCQRCGTKTGDPMRDAVRHKDVHRRRHGRGNSRL